MSQSNSNSHQPTTFFTQKESSSSSSTKVFPFLNQDVNSDDDFETLAPFPRSPPKRPLKRKNGSSHQEKPHSTRISPGSNKNKRSPNGGPPQAKKRKFSIAGSQKLNFFEKLISEAPPKDQPLILTGNEVLNDGSPVKLPSKSTSQDSNILSPAEKSKKSVGIQDELPPPVVVDPLDFKINKHGATECQICFCPVLPTERNRITEHCVCKDCSKTLKKDLFGTKEVSYYCATCKKVVPAQIYDESRDCDDSDGDGEDFKLDPAMIDEWRTISSNLRAKEEENREKVKLIESHLGSIKKELMDVFGWFSYNVSMAINERQEATESEFRKAICENKKFSRLKKRRELIESVSQRVAGIVASLESIKLWKDNQTIEVYTSAVESQAMAVIDALTLINGEYADDTDTDNDDDDYEEPEDEGEEEAEEGSWKNVPNFKFPVFSVEDAKSYSSHAFLKKDLERIKVLFDIDRIKEIINELYKYQV